MAFEKSKLSEYGPDPFSDWMLRPNSPLSQNPETSEFILEDPFPSPAENPFTINEESREAARTLTALRGNPNQGAMDEAKKMMEQNPLPELPEGGGKFGEPGQARAAAGQGFYRDKREGKAFNRDPNWLTNAIRDWKNKGEEERREFQKKLAEQQADSADDFANAAAVQLGGQGPLGVDLQPDIIDDLMEPIPVAAAVPIEAMDTRERVAASRAEKEEPLNQGKEDKPDDNKNPVDPPAANGDEQPGKGDPPAGELVQEIGMPNAPQVPIMTSPADPGMSVVYTNHLDSRGNRPKQSEAGTGIRGEVDGSDLVNQFAETMGSVVNSLDMIKENLRVHHHAILAINDQFDVEGYCDVG